MDLSDAEQRSIYPRPLNDGRRTSLSVLQELVPWGSEVLDVGIGSGALGESLTRDRGCRVDGVTVSEEEAAGAAANYRRIVVADLETTALTTLFGGRRYGAIICADVIEHVTHPTAVIDACRELLANDGVLLLSVPNVAYVGLIGELLGGEFRYREEGLLDRTHLRFFTRASLLRMLEDRGWTVDLVDRIKLDLPDCEFRVAFDRLPPAVRRYLLSMPDGLTYQFLVRARPAHGPAAHSESTTAAPLVDVAHFSAQLYLKEEDGYSEERKVIARGRIGEERQRIRFELPQRRLAGLRLDPADRPGFLRLYGIRLLSPEGTVWAWDGTHASLTRGDHQQFQFRPPAAEGEGATLLLAGEDPYFELPVTAEQLARCRTGGVLEVDMAWPMSSEYALFIDELAQSRGQREALQRELAQAHDSAARLSVAEQEVAQLKLALAAQEALVRELRVQTEASHGESATVAPREAPRATASSSAGSPVARAVRAARARVARLLASDGLAERTAAQAPVAAAVEVIVPVYRGLDETRTCVESLLASSPATPFRVTLINDASPEPEITAYLRALARRDARVDLLENPSNVGFVASANRGMQHAGRRDVVLLNSDTEVAGDWLDRLRRAAYRGARIATATPFSNAATICSYPRFCRDSGLPHGMTTAELDRLFAVENRGQAMEIPTAVGFCMYVRRDCLDAVGPFDVERFGRGYGEENDFCMRARAAGWQHVLAADTFVMHAGGVSFGDEKARRVRQAQEALAQLHPEYPQLVARHIAADPARLARASVDIARVRESGLHSVLFVSHVGGGGTERHLRELAAALERKAHVFLLRPTASDETVLEALGHEEGFSLSFRLDSQREALLKTLRALRVSHIHVHHLLGHSPCVADLPRALGVTHDFTAHDFHSACPQISLTDANLRYCGEKGAAQCRDCLAQRPAPDNVSIESWRASYRPLIEGARHVFAPSAETAQRLRRYFPAARVVVAPHFDLAAVPAVSAPQPIGAERPLRIVVVGAISQIKGADVLEAAAIEAARQRLPLEFHLLGYAYRPLQGEPAAQLTVHGRYEESDLPGRLAELKPDVAWFPAQWPETYSYTLSACLEARLPMVAVYLGAFAERLHEREWTWLCPWDWPAAEWARFFDRVRREHFVTGVAPARALGVAVDAPCFRYDRDYLPDAVPDVDAPRLSRELLQRLVPGSIAPDRSSGVEHPDRAARPSVRA